jgi:glycosyltransferase involved in cell wall biosynthesis
MTLDRAKASSVQSAFSIGICASDRSEKLPLLLRVLESEQFNKNGMRRIIIVASGCSVTTLARLREIANRDRRVQLIEEPVRLGKSEALNRIIENRIGDFLVLVNSDAIPEDDAINTLIEAIERNPRVGVVSASPFFEPSKGVVSGILDLMWTLHNDWSLRLNHAGLNNHASDELMVVSSRALSKLPRGVINDGAYIAGTAFLKGFMIKFSEEARVQIDVPDRLTDLIQQRRRILFGHFQVWKWLGQSPRTPELMLLTAPTLTLGLLIRRIAESPRLLRVLPIALISESVALFLAVKDSITSTKRHTVWRRYDTHLPLM